jgi:hypothetical protein
MAIDDTLVFTTVDGGFDFKMCKSNTSVEIIYSCKKHR